MNQIVTNKYQAPKHMRPVSERHCDGSDFRGDVRFRDYSDALKSGNLDECKRLRTNNNKDREFQTKCNTLDRLWIGEMTLYIREVQISNRERDGYRDLAVGWEKKFNKDSSAPNHNTLIRRGKAVLKQAAEARTIHDNPEVQSNFPRPL